MTPWDLCGRFEKEAAASLRARPLLVSRTEATNEHRKHTPIEHALRQIMKSLNRQLYIHAFPWCWHCYDGLRGIEYSRLGALRVALACRWRRSA